MTAREARTATAREVMDASARDRMTAATGRSLQFGVTVRPVPKARPRVVDGHAYTPRRTRAFEQTVGWTAREAMMRAGAEMLTGPVLVDLVVVAAAANADLDNIAKAVLDGLQGVVFADDRQVAALALWREARGLPGVRIEVIGLEA